MMLAPVLAHLLLAGCNGCSDPSTKGDVVEDDSKEPDGADGPGEAAEGEGEGESGGPIWPIGAGSTEIWKNGNLHGVAYRMNGSDQEYVYLFEEGIAPGNAPFQHPPLGLVPYPETLAPTPDFNPVNDGATLEFRPLRTCPQAYTPIEDCPICDSTSGNDWCFDTFGEFADPTPGKGVWQILQDRAGYTGKPVRLIERTFGQGTVSAAQPFTVTACEQAAAPAGTSPAHGDRVIQGSDKGWAYIANTSSGGQTTQLQVVVLPGTEIYVTGYTVLNDTLPAETDTPANGRWDEWCAARGAYCHSNGCTLQTVSYVFP